MPLIWGVDVQLHSLLTFAVDGGDWSTACHGCFIQWASPRHPVKGKENFSFYGDTIRMRI